jgi:long-subunit fatty acid transport protein
MKKDKRYILYAIMISILPFICHAQIRIIGIESSPNPVGSGARALGMGGAFIGIADDATAASWNPGGLTQLKKPEISIVTAYDSRSNDITYQINHQASGKHHVDALDLNYFSFAYPFQWYHRNMIFSINYQHLYDFDQELTYAYSYVDPDPPETIEHTKVNYKQEGALYAISPAFAIKVTPQLSLGFTLNIWDKAFCHWKNRYTATGDMTIADSTFQMSIDKRETRKFRGINANLGFLWKINPIFTLGGVIKTPFRATIDHDYQTQEWLPSANGMKPVYNQTNDTEKLDMPMSYGIGLAARFSDLLSCDIDIYRTQWNDYIKHNAQGIEINPITGKAIVNSQSKPATQIRLGMEYLLIINQIVYPLHMGLFYDPEPAHNHPEDFYGVSVGTGIVLKNMVFDMAYSYRFGNNVSIKTFTIGHENPVEDVVQHTLSMSVIYHF